MIVGIGKDHGSVDSITAGRWAAFVRSLEADPELRTGQEGAHSALEQLRDLLIRLSEHWPHYRVFDWQKDVPWTNNGTERVIGRMKVRSKTVRGYKTEPGMLAGLMLAGSGVC